MGRLRAIGAVFAAAAGFDAEQAAPRHFLAAPMLEMNCAALRNEIEKRLMIEQAQPIELHRAAILIPNSEIRNPNFSSPSDRFAKRGPGVLPSYTGSCRQRRSCACRCRAASN